MEPDYPKLGLRVGFEIHQELDTSKLFCACPSGLSEGGPKAVVLRRLRPSQSEMGEVDRAAISEAMRGKSFRYHVTDNSCLVELDCEPPHSPNEEALDACLQVALMLNARPVDEVHTMRKIVIDGSNPSGFQRTMLVATGGRLRVDGREFSIPTICLEEDAARKIGEDDRFVDFKLDRLGIPLIEIATGPDFSDPETAARAALHIGRILRCTGKVRRGIGTIRQDINISISGGARQEIKGVQELGLIPEVIRREVRRQLSLIGIREELRRRGARPSQPRVTDVSPVFSGTRSNILRRTLEGGGGVFAVRLPGFAGILGREVQPGRRFGTELADRARIYGGVGGIFHTDELPAYGISADEVSRLREFVGASDGDCVVFVAGSRENAEAALRAVVERANQAIEGVPEETRRALPDGNTEFMRPLPGAGRMYPETDIPPIPVTPGRVRRLMRDLPEDPEGRVRRLMRRYGLSRELAERVGFSDNLDVFERLSATGASPTLIASTLEETMVGLKREGVRVESVREEQLRRIFELVAAGEIAKEAVPGIIREVAGGMGVDEAVRKLGLTPLAPEDLMRIVKEVVAEGEGLIRERGAGAVMPLMGVLMERVRGRADGRKVRELLEAEVRKRLDSGGSEQEGKRNG